MGDVLYRLADANFNGRFIIDYESDEIEFLNPVFSDKFCIIAPSALQIPSWMSIFRCYSVGVWSLILATLLVCTILLHFLRKWEAKMNLNANLTGKMKRRFKLNIVFTDMILVFTGGPIENRPFRANERIFIGFCLIFNIIIAGTFQVSICWRNCFEQKRNIYVFAGFIDNIIQYNRL